VCLRASGLSVFDGKREVVPHERLMGKGGERLVLNHYLEVLIRKPGALPGATALVQARESGMFTAAHDAFWSAARKAATLPGPGRSSRRCCCTATCRMPTSSPASGQP
jgi:hypothetical protein